MCVFSTHDLVKDPPFSKLDLVSCRNLLIYFEPQLQQRVVRHLPLRPAAGRAAVPRTLGGCRRAAQLFAPLDKRHRLYRAAGHRGELPGLRARALPERSRAPAAAVRARGGRRHRPARGRAPSRRTLRRSWSWTTSTTSCVSPARRRRYLEPATGDRELRPRSPAAHGSAGRRARTALKQAAATGAPVRHDDRPHQDGRAARGRQPDRRAASRPGGELPVRGRVPGGGPGCAATPQAAGSDARG